MKLIKFIAKAYLNVWVLVIFALWFLFWGIYSLVTMDSIVALAVDIFFFAFYVFILICKFIGKRKGW